MIRPLGHLPPEVTPPPPPVDKFGIPLPQTTPKKWGTLVSDYGRAGDLVEKGWIQRRLTNTLSEPILGKAPTHIKGIPGKLSPSVDSPNVSCCMVGGTTISL